jgi:hypothetical protein
VALKVVGAGLGRTGTLSLKLALEQLLGEPCYHMIEVIAHPEFIPYWVDATNRRPVDWDKAMDGYAAAVDWPVCAFWRELAAANPDAIILLSTRATADDWWRSANNTIFLVSRHDPPPEMVAQRDMAIAMFRETFTPDWLDETAAKAAYERHNADVRASAPADRLVDWQPGDGWAPICHALGVAVPDAPFPHANSTEDFRAMIGLDKS